MNIGVNSNLTTNTVSSTSSSKSQNADSPKFAEELQNLSGEKTKEEKTSEIWPHIKKQHLPFLMDEPRDNGLS